ncbi:MAG: TetR/AcrR family transcriptional regulator [Spirochaetaceae bacterium]
MSKKDAILDRASEVFFKFGLTKISMDELADQIGISKKTIYNNYGSKENLLEAIIFSSMEKVLEDITNLFASTDKTIVEKIFLAIKHVYTQYSNFEVPTRSDPNAARIIYSPECLFLTDQIQDNIRRLAIEGQQKGVIKKHINIDMVPFIFLNSIRGLATWQKPESLPFSKLELMRNSIEIILDGILTPTAMNEYLNS